MCQYKYLNEHFVVSRINTLIYKNLYPMNIFKKKLLERDLVTDFCF